MDYSRHTTRTGLSLPLAITSMEMSTVFGATTTQMDSPQPKDITRMGKKLAFGTTGIPMEAKDSSRSNRRSNWDARKAARPLS